MDEKQAEAAIAAFVKRLKAARLRQGLSLQQVADSAGLSPSGVKRIEDGERTPSLYAVFRISAAVGIDIGDLISRDQ